MKKLADISFFESLGGSSVSANACFDAVIQNGSGSKILYIATLLALVAAGTIGMRKVYDYATKMGISKDEVHSVQQQMGTIVEDVMTEDVITEDVIYEDVIPDTIIEENIVPENVQTWDNNPNIHTWD